MKFCSVFLAVLLIFSPIYTVFAQVNTPSVSETNEVSDTFASQNVVPLVSQEVVVITTQTPNIIAQSSTTCDISTAAEQSSLLLQPQAFFNLNQPANCFNLGTIPLKESSSVITIDHSKPITTHVAVVRHIYFTESHALPENSHVPFRIPTPTPSQFSYAAAILVCLFILLIVCSPRYFSRRASSLNSLTFRELCVMRC